MEMLIAMAMLKGLCLSQAVQLGELRPYHDSRLPFRHIVTNPFIQVLEFAAAYLGVQDFFNKVFIFTINLNWWGWIRPLT
jgi:hypothetical protein